MAMVEITQGGEWRIWEGSQGNIQGVAQDEKLERARKKKKKRLEENKPASEATQPRGIFVSQEGAQKEQTQAGPGHGT